MTSASPPSDDEDENGPSPLVALGKKPRKQAAYVPQHAQSSFTKSATPMTQRDPERASQVSGLYRSTSTTEQIDGQGLASSGKRKGKVARTDYAVS